MIKKQITVTRSGYKTRKSKIFTSDAENQNWDELELRLQALRTSGDFLKEDGEIAIIGPNFLKDAVIEVVNVTEQAAAPAAE